MSADSGRGGEGAMEFSEELSRKVDEAAARYPSKMAALLPALHLVQKEFGWISVEAQEWVARKLDLPPSHVHGCVSFYTLYKTRPMGRHHIQVCRTLSCALRGGEDLLDHLKKKLGIGPGEVTPDGRFSLVAVECLGSCGTAPMFQVNDDYHENLTLEKVDALLETME